MSIFAIIGFAVIAIIIGVLLFKVGAYIIGAILCLALVIGIFILCASCGAAM